MPDKKDRLLKAGKTLFSTRGFKDTNVAMIAKKAGIATGTFYNYYSSKDTLFMEIFLEENSLLKKKIMKTVDLSKNPMEVISELMALNHQGMINNPILKEWYNKEIFKKIETTYREKKGLKEMDFLYQDFYEIIGKWQKAGKMRNDISVEMIMALFTSIITIDTYKEEIGVQYFPEIMNYLVKFILEGLMKNPL